MQKTNTNETMNNEFENILNALSGSANSSGLKKSVVQWLDKKCQAKMNEIISFSLSALTKKKVIEANNLIQNMIGISEEYRLPEFRILKVEKFHTNRKISEPQGWKLVFTSIPLEFLAEKFQVKQGTREYEYLFSRIYQGKNGISFSQSNEKNLIFLTTNEGIKGKYPRFYNGMSF